MNYDRLIKAHYDRVAEQDGESPSSTMADQIVRETETETILRFVERREMTRKENEIQEPLIVADIGCGNGYTISQLRKRFPSGPAFYGVEQNDRLREIAARSCTNIISGDIRDSSTIAMEPKSLDVLICQRVIINIMDAEDQKRALRNCISLVKDGGALLFIEVFQSGIDLLNEARAEWDLEPIPPAHHNLPLTDDFFDEQPALVPIKNNRHKLSSHFFVTRVLHELATRASGQNDFTRNSHFVRFLSGAFQPTGEYAPLQFMAFQCHHPR